MIFKRLASGFIAIAMIAGMTTKMSSAPETAMANAASAKPNYAEALQKSLFFYEAQQAGPLPEWNRVEWRADSTMTDGVLGGWYDAGDHVKFNLPMSYSASMLAWGLYQYPDGVEKIGEMTNYVNNLTFVLDYFVACDRGTEVVYQVGNGNVDHTWWGPVELIEEGMGDAGTSMKDAREMLVGSKGCSAVIASMSAALSSGYAALKGRTDSAKLAKYLSTAKSYFEIADAAGGDTVYNNSDASGFYRSSHFYDNLFYAANWLYIATGEQKYLDKAASYIPNLDKMLGQGDTLSYGWGHCWDDNMQGGMLLYAINTKEQKYIDHVKKHVEYWQKDVPILPGGHRYLMNWGNLRHSTTTSFLIQVACDTVLTSNNKDYIDLSETMMDYALGVNPTKQSYVIGYGEAQGLKLTRNGHHRTAHCSWKNDLAIPDDNRHILYGALVGGPDQSGGYVDDRGDFQLNEVATDYNAGYTAMLCAMVDKYGGKTDPSFPRPEKHDMPEFFIEASGKNSASGVDLKLEFTNRSAWPARIENNLSLRYFMDLSEVIALGKNPTDIVVRCDRDQAAMYAGRGVKPANISKPIQYSGSIYYIEITLPDGRAVVPVSEGMNQCEIMLALVMPDYGTGWDSSNDYSFKDLDASKLTIQNKIPMYINGKLYYGTEPDGTTADGGMSGGTVKPTNPPTTKPTETTVTSVSDTKNGTVKYGDVNLDGDVTIDDVVVLRLYLLKPDVYSIDEKAQENAKVIVGQNSIQGNCAVTIQDFVVEKIKALPYGG